MGERIDHVDGVTVEEAEHMLATRLWQNTAKLHFDATQREDGRRLIYGGHVISLARALSFNGLANAAMIVALNGGAHANPCFAGDTVRAWSEVLDKAETGAPGVGALRLRLVAVKDGHGALRAEGCGRASTCRACCWISTTGCWFPAESEGVSPETHWAYLECRGAAIFVITALKAVITTSGICRKWRISQGFLFIGMCDTADFGVMEGAPAAGSRDEARGRDHGGNQIGAASAFAAYPDL